MRHIARRCAVDGGDAGCAAPASAADYPSGTIRVLSSTFPGGIIDLLARTYAQKLQDRGGQTVVVENNSVATGSVGVGQNAQLPPDGYNCWSVMPRT